MEALTALRKADLLKEENMAGINFRTCPGTHECPRASAATREVGAEIIANLGGNGRALKLALAGCPNSCVRPQTADIGIVAKGKSPKFDVYRRQGEKLGKIIHRGLDMNNLLKVIREIN
jgi:sulfite reductase beta subunit-like hemoprotein